MIGILVILKYIACVAILAAIVMMPAYLARQTKRDNVAMVRIRAASWLFMWTGVGWLFALIHAVQK